MFPAHAGMNRHTITAALRSRNVPRTRGDEPVMAWSEEATRSMFPAHAGMNRLCSS